MKQQSPKKLIATYDYTDENGNLLFQVLRYEPKDFRQRAPDGNGGWVWSLAGIRRVLYHLPLILEDSTVFVVEGEKDADRLISEGITATTCPSGARSWSSVDSSPLHGKNVIVIPDNDEPGRQHALIVAASLYGKAADVRILELPNLPPKGDVSDWLDAGRTATDLWVLASQAPAFRPNDAGQEIDTTTNPSPKMESQVPSNLNGGPWDGTCRKVRAVDLVSSEESELPWLPFLGLDGYLVEGWCHLISAYPKVGKTELLLALSQEWSALGKSVLHATEEHLSLWRHRFQNAGGNIDNITMLEAFGAGSLSILREIERSDFDIIIIDTVRNLLGIEDENDNSKVARALTPIIAMARKKGATLIMLHHTKKEAGQHGRGISGAHAMLGLVDLSIEISRDDKAERRRKVTGLGRIVAVPELIYEMSDAGKLSALGDPQKFSLNNVMLEAKRAVCVTPLTTEDILTSLPNPKPSYEQIRKALNHLGETGEIIRIPGMAEGPKRGMLHHWQLPSNGSPLRLDGSLDGSAEDIQRR